MPKIDLLYYPYGSVTAVETCSRAGKEWVRENVQIPEWAGTEARFTGDWRPMRDLLDGARAAGLNVAEAA